MIVDPSYTDHMPHPSSHLDFSSVSASPSHQLDVQAGPSPIPDAQPGPSHRPDAQPGLSHRQGAQNYPSDRSLTPTLCSFDAARRKRARNRSGNAAAVRMDITDVEKAYFEKQTQVGEALLQFLPVAERVLLAQEKILSAQEKVLSAQEKVLMLKARKLELELQGANFHNI